MYVRFFVFVIHVHGCWCSKRWRYECLSANEHTHVRLTQQTNYMEKKLNLRYIRFKCVEKSCCATCCFRPIVNCQMPEWLQRFGRPLSRPKLVMVECGEWCLLRFRFEVNSNSCTVYINYRQSTCWLPFHVVRTSVCMCVRDSTHVLNEVALFDM